MLNDALKHTVGVGRLNRKRASSESVAGKEGKVITFGLRCTAVVCMNVTILFSAR